MERYKLILQFLSDLELFYEDSDGKRRTPVMIHRAILGSLERFIGILLEHYGGYFPLWLSPIQAKIMCITKQEKDYTWEVERYLKKHQIRVETDTTDQKLGYKIRKAELEKVNFMLILGKKERESKTVSVRHHRRGDLGVMRLEDVLHEITN